MNRLISKSARTAAPTVRTDRTPATFAGNGEQIRDVTVSCPDQDPVTLTLGINWFSGQGEVSEDGLTIEGGITNPPASSSFRFVRP